MAVIEERILSDGKKSYRVKVRLRGFPPQNATFDKITDARRWEQDTESAIREGRYFKTAKAKKHTVLQTLGIKITLVSPDSTGNSDEAEEK